MSRLIKDFNFNNHWLLSAACAEWINPINDDKIFCDVEWNFIQFWFQERGFTENDYRFIETLGYERDQFRKEVI